MLLLFHCVFQQEKTEIAGTFENPEIPLKIRLMFSQNWIETF